VASISLLDHLTGQRFLPAESGFGETISARRCPTGKAHMAATLGKTGIFGAGKYTSTMPEKSFNEVPRIERELFEKGMAAVERNNLDYALVIFNQILSKEPGFYECREKLRGAQLTKAGKGSSLFKKFLGKAGSSPNLAKAQIVLRNNPLEAIKAVEEILNGDPNNVLAHKTLAEAAIAADLPRTAVLSLEIARRAAPEDQDVALRLAEALVLIGNVSRAMAIYNELKRLNPHDTELDMTIKNLTASITMAEGGYDEIATGNASYRDILKDKDEAVSLEQQNRVEKAGDIARRLISEYQARLEQEPRNLKLIRDIANLYTQTKDFDKALEYYHRIAAEEGLNDPSLEKAISDTNLRKFDYQISQLDANAADHAEQSGKLQAERQEFLIKDARRRVEKYPNDLSLRFELGTILFNAKKYGEAIAEFQKSQNNPHLRIRSLIVLGQCFLGRNMNDLAVRALQNALKEKVGFDEERKEILYFLGVALEKMGKREEAIEQFKLIYEVDSAYRDVAARVDAFYAGN
jgi:tetratricopeptide (TPR) repeat protein